MKLVLALIAFMGMVLFAPATGLIGVKKETKKVPCAEYTAMYYVSGCDRNGTGTTGFNSTKDVDNEKAEEKAERRGEEYENEAQEEKHETKAQEQAEQVTTHTAGSDEGGSNNGSNGGREPGANR